MNAAEHLPREFNAAAHFVDRHVEEGRGGWSAFSYRERTFTYADVADLVNRTGNALLELGVEMEQRVLMICLDAPEFVGTFWGAIKIGAIPVPVNTLLRSSDYAYVLNDSRARVLVVSAPLLEVVEPVVAQARHLRQVLVADGLPGRHVPYEDRLARASTRLSPAPTTRDDVAFWQYSSGSTGPPKGVLHLQHDMVVSAETYGKYVLGIVPEDKVYSAAKLFFGYGLGNAGFLPMHVGAQSVLYPHRPTPERVFELLDRHRPTIFFAVPTLFAGMLAVPEAEERYDLRSVRLCVSAGEALPERIYRDWRQRFGVEILDGVGTTETLHVFLSNRPGSVHPGSSGVPVPGYEAILVDDEGRPVPRGEIGTLRVRGDSNMALYWNQHEKTKEVVVGGWVQTGDKFYQDPDGYFWYRGRADDMMKVGGIWVSPAEVEATLVQHPAVLEAAVVAHEDDAGLVKPKAFVVLTDSHLDSSALAEELKAFVKQRIAPYKYPRSFEFVPALPKTATGKIQRFKLRA